MRGPGERGAGPSDAVQQPRTRQRAPRLRVNAGCSYGQYCSGPYSQVNVPTQTQWRALRTGARAGQGRVPFAAAARFDVQTCRPFPRHPTHTHVHCAHGGVTVATTCFEQVHHRDEYCDTKRSGDHLLRIVDRPLVASPPFCRRFKPPGEAHHLATASGPPHSPPGAACFPRLLSPGFPLLLTEMNPGPRSCHGSRRVPRG